MVIEIAIIGGQAWRGTTSHFNVGSVLDAVLFTIMGAAIFIQTISTIAVAVALWRRRFEDEGLGWALRFGVTLTIVGALTGGLMTRPTAAQLEAARTGARMTVSGAHTVGAPDGGPGLTGTGWSTEHGDLRVPHFIGLHAMQVLPLFAFALTRRRLPQIVRARLVLIASASYAALYVILLTQALRGIPLIAADAVTITSVIGWLAATAITAGVVLPGRLRQERHSAAI
jgi:hypothetical protein